MKDHEWRVQRRRGYCNQLCGCSKFRPDTNQPRPINKLLGRQLYGKEPRELKRLMTPEEAKRRIKDEEEA